MARYRVDFFKKQEDRERNVSYTKIGSVEVSENVDPFKDQSFPLVAKAFRHAPQACRAANKVEFTKL